MQVKGEDAELDDLRVPAGFVHDVRHGDDLERAKRASQGELKRALHLWLNKSGRPDAIAVPEEQMDDEIRCAVC